MSFAIPVVWREGKDHMTNCYFYTKNLNVIDRKYKFHVQYSDVHFAIRQIPHGQDLSVPEPDGNMEYCSNSKHTDMNIVSGYDVYKREKDDQPVALTQVEFKGLTRDLNLSKESTLLLGSRLEEKHLFAPGTTFYSY